MTNLSAIENKVSSIRKYLNILEHYKKYSKEEIEKDLTLRGALERYLYLAAQSVIDLAEAILSFKRLRKPTTMSESFYILAEEKLIHDVVVEKMVKLVGFRNVMAHDYEKVNYDIVYDILHNRLRDIEVFLESIQPHLS